VSTDEWGTSGRIRPTIRDLWELCAELDLRRACDYIAANILGRGEPDISPTGLKAKLIFLLRYFSASATGGEREVTGIY
jgi:hypothetical protein